MALQMGVVIACAFVVGYAALPARCSWIVLTAYLVQSGNRGRAEVAYKSAQRVAGTTVGTFVALSLARPFGAHDTTTVALIFAALFVGVWLRPLGYAWWCCA